MLRTSELAALAAVAFIVIPARAVAQPVAAPSVVSGSCFDMRDMKVASDPSGSDGTNGNDSWHNVSTAGAATVRPTSKGCIAVTFSAQVDSHSKDAPLIRALLDGSPTCKPSQAQFAVGSVDAAQVYQSMTFYCYGNPGTHVVRMQFQNSLQFGAHNDQLNGRLLEVRYRK